MSIRRALHASGLRYRLHERPLPELRRQADIVFRSARVAVMVDGCFWHGCPEHGTWPKTNADWWRSKIDKNRSRDLETDATLRRAGWRVIRVWEHEEPEAAAARIADVVRRRPGGRTPPLDA